MPIFDPDSDIITGPIIEGAPEEPVLRVHEIQGNILPGFGALGQVLLGVRFEKTELPAVRRWIRFLIPMVSTLAQVNDFRNLRRRAFRRSEPRLPSPVWANVAFSQLGLNLLAGETERIRDAAFKQGMAARSAELGDPSDSAMEGHTCKWKIGGSLDKTPDALIITAADDKSELFRRAKEIKTSITENSAISLIYEQFGFTLEDDREHFGFRDGVSQVGVRGRLSENERHYLTRRYIDPADSTAKTFSKPGQPLVYPGQFVFGYPKQQESDVLSPGQVADGGYEWMNDGSFLVFRRLRQDVKIFRSFLHQEVERLKLLDGFAELTEENFAAMLVGRHPKGTALIRNPQTDDAAPMNDRLSVIHFGFGNAAQNVEVCADPFVAVESLIAEENEPEMRTVNGTPADLIGLRCPRFAHIRKVNPRDRTTDQGGSAKTITFQMMRRSVTWGTPYPSTPEEQNQDDGDRGLLFMSYQTSIENQFELLNNRWMNRETGPESGGHDLLVGQGNSGQTAERICRLKSSQGIEAEIRTLKHWVIPTGGGYFFAPSLGVLRRFAEEM